MTRTRMRCCALMGVVVAFLSAAAFAAVGDLEYASNPPPGRGLNVGFRDPEKVSDGGKMGLDSANAVVATGVASGIKISAALTRSKAGAEDFDVLRLDTTGTLCSGQVASSPGAARRATPCRSCLSSACYPPR